MPDGSGAAPPDDVGPEDAGPEDAGPNDAGPNDAGPNDAGPNDAGPEDAPPSKLTELLASHAGRFIVVGLSNLVLSYVAYWLLLKLFAGFALRGAASQAITYAIGTTWSYFWNRRWTFQSDQPALGEASRFVAVQVVLALCSSALIGVAVDWLHLHETLSWFVVVGVITVANYGLSKFFVFNATSAEKV